MVTYGTNVAWCDEHGEMEYMLTPDGQRIAWVMCPQCREAHPC